MPRKPRDAGSDGIDEVIEWFEVSEEPTSEQPRAEAATQAEAERPPVSGTESSPALERWTRLIRSFRKIRRLQRIYHNAGERLQDFPKSLRDGIAKAYPKK